MHSGTWNLYTAENKNYYNIYGGNHFSELKFLHKSPKSRGKKFKLKKKKKNNNDRNIDFYTRASFCHQINLFRVWRIKINIRK